MNDSYTINKINDYLKTQLWMDFTLSSFDPGCAEIIGRIDQSGGDIKIIIRFIEPYLVICPLFFTFEGKNDFITVVNKDCAYRKNIDYDIRQGNTLFQISNTNIQGEIIIAAQRIIAEIRTMGQTNY